MIKVIDRLFQRMSATYGAEWDRSLGHTPIADVKTVWAHELEPYKSSLHRIAWALENLPERCPNVITFKKLCQQAPSPDVVSLPAPQTDPAKVAAELAKLANIRSEKASSYDFKGWAKRLKALHESGHNLNANQIRCYRNALGLNRPAV